MSGLGDAFDGHVLDLELPATLGAMRVDRVLAMLTGISRAEASDLIDAGAVVVDGRVATKGSLQVEAGQHLVATLPEPAPDDVQPDASVPVDVVLEDESFLVINKRPGQVVHPGAGQREGTLVAGLLARYPELRRLSEEGLSDPFRPGIVHRLDKGTSGVLVVARTPEAVVDLREQLAERSMTRVYIGLVEGHVTEERGVVDAPIGRSTRTPTLMAVRADGRPARTGYDVIERIDKPHAVTLLQLQLETGRTHQIRVHLATIGHPIVNDPRYGHRRDKRLDAERFFLHSARLSFDHPRTGERVSTSTPLPEDLRALLPGVVDL